MSDFIIKKATKKAKKLRLGIEAPSGFGKTKGALLLAFGITGNWEDICLIDSENDSGSLYADLGPYSVVNISNPFSPENYINAITAVEKAGFKVCIIDSITPEWEGIGGCLDIHQSLGGTFKEWNPVGKRHTAFINKILNSKIHIITTVRKKQEHEIVHDNGKMKIQKVGLKAQTREGKLNY